MTLKNTRRKLLEKSEKSLCDRADKSSRHFISTLASAILTLPLIQEKTQEATNKKCCKVLDRLLKAFIEAQSDAQKAGFVSCMNQFTSK